MDFYIYIAISSEQSRTGKGWKTEAQQALAELYVEGTGRIDRFLCCCCNELYTRRRNKISSPRSTRKKERKEDRINYFANTALQLQVSVLRDQWRRRRGRGRIWSQEERRRRSWSRCSSLEMLSDSRRLVSSDSCSHVSGPDACSARTVDRYASSSSSWTSTPPPLPPEASCDPSLSTPSSSVLPDDAHGSPAPAAADMASPRPTEQHPLPNRSSSAAATLSALQLATEHSASASSLTWRYLCCRGWWSAIAAAVLWACEMSLLLCTG